MTLIFAALVIGLVAGSRTLLAPAAVSLAAISGWIDLSLSPLAFLGMTPSAVVFAGLALAELVADTLPWVPSRKTVGPFLCRIVSGGLCGAALGSLGGALLAGLIAGVTGAAGGTLAGYAARMRMAAACGRDLPAALIEDGAAVALAVVAITLAS
ncbi:DUF4126 family protein [Marinivivus vitaminiproducens]|uniref:DUF4126 family protein n=1 Tax=Marinivivus vitaminiproducens TaxID=3035935 RepID=UPI0027A52D07|nr:DUF4126 family protein [Geminicoccaceae bacterium SCSIO 64248]